MWRWWWGVGAVWLALAQPALAQRIPLNAASAFSMRLADASCGVSVTEGGAGQSGYVTRSCDASTDESFVWLFRWLPGMPTTGTVSVDLEGLALDGVGGRNTCIEVRLGCADAGTDVDLTFGTASTACDDYPFSFTDFTIKSFTGVALPSTIGTDRWCGLKVTRDADNASDTDTGDWIVRGGAIKW